MTDPFKDTPLKYLKTCVFRWIGAIIVVATSGYAAYDDVRDKAEANWNAIKDHSAALADLQEQDTLFQIQLADGSSAAQASTNRRVRAVEQFVEQQRSYNATIVEQNRQTRETVREQREDIKGLRSDMHELNGNVGAIRRLLEAREGRPHDR